MYEDKRQRRVEQPRSNSERIIRASEFSKSCKGGADQMEGDRFSPNLKGSSKKSLPYEEKGPNRRNCRFLDNTAIRFRKESSYSPFYSSSAFELCPTRLSSESFLHNKTTQKPGAANGSCETAEKCESFPCSPAGDNDVATEEDSVTLEEAISSDNPTYDSNSNGTHNGYDPRKRAVFFERAVEELFHLGPSEGEGKFDNLLKKMEAKEKMLQIEMQQTALEEELRSDFEQRKKEQRQQQEPNNVNAKGSVYSRVAKKNIIAVLASNKFSSTLGTKEKGDGAALSAWNADEEDLADATEEVRLERKLEAVFVSFALYGCWRPDELVYPQSSSGMGGLRFTALCREAGLIDGKHVTTKVIHDVFQSLMDKMKMKLFFPQFLMALSRVAEHGNKDPEAAMKAVLDINSEGLLRIHVNDS
eukprot:CAMPEP_0177597690 /NCGR_PEP_ID=MMETSP0419_2-20121207/11863_1 /TAXON_ID=582737 /ORGANISM="Tetraselmis sp., Strain GSL018" /LENGTH=416 /DNA_ID=CAMNT_0019089911 /DNA_START=729 /DNA_END=1980 /DNA_ORIENTATION=+